jgi:hypothetical protein
MDMSKAKETATDFLFELFAGEHVSILIDMQVESVVQKEDTVEMIKTPLNVTGYLTDEDQNFYFLGHEPDIYTQAVSKSRIVHIEVVEEEKPKKNEVFKNAKGPDGRGLN